MNNFKPVIILEPGEEEADITVLIPHVPAGEKGWPGGPPNLMKYGEKEGDGEEKDDDEEEEGMKGKRMDEEDMQDSLMVEEGMIVKYPLVFVAIFSALASRFFPARRS